MLAKYRIDRVIYNSVVVTDRQIVHSPIFNKVFNEREFFKNVGDGFFEIRTKNTGFEKTVVDYFVEKDGKISTMLFTYIDPENNLKYLLQNSKNVKKPRNLNDVRVLLRDVLGSQYWEKIEESYRSWCYVLEMSQVGTVILKEWGGESFNDLMQKSRVQMAGRAKELGSLEEEIVGRFLSGEQSRGDIAGEMHRRLEYQLDGYSAYVRSSNLISKYYNKAIQNQHGCDSLEVVEDVFGMSPDVAHEKFYRAEQGFVDAYGEVRLDASLLLGIAEMPVDAFDQWIVFNSARIQRWKDSGDLDELKIVVDDVIEYAEKYGIRSDHLKNGNIDKSTKELHVSIANAAIKTASNMIPVFGVVFEFILGVVGNVSADKASKT